MSIRSQKLMLDKPFSSSLQNFIAEFLKLDWATIAPSFLLFRDFEDLPTSAPFDVDVICENVDWPVVMRTFETMASNNGLVVSSNSGADSLMLLSLDVSGDTQTRRHFFLEIRNRLVVPFRQLGLDQMQGSIQIVSEMVPRNRSVSYPAPTGPWAYFFLLLQALRKPNSQKYIQRLNCFDPDHATAGKQVAETFLGLDTAQIETRLVTVSAPNIPRAIVPANARSFVDRVKIHCLNWLFFLPLLRMDFVTIHGPDGVGKSTTCREIENVFDGLPIGLYQFHHSEGWKISNRVSSSNAEMQTSSPKHETTECAPLWRLILQRVYRVLPEPLKQLWLWNSHFINYNRRFSRFLFENRNKGSILFSDRYVYDVRVKYIIETPQPSWLTRFYYRFHSALMPRPQYGFLLVDEPSRIVERKDELTETQVEQFIVWITKFLRQHRVPFSTIAVAERSPREIASEIVLELLQRQGPVLIGHMRAYVSELERADALPQREVGA